MSFYSGRDQMRFVSKNQRDVFLYHRQRRQNNQNLGNRSQKQENRPDAHRTQWNSNTNNIRAFLRNDCHQVFDMKYNHETDTLYTCANDKTFRIWK